MYTKQKGKGRTAKEMVVWKQKRYGRWKRCTPKIYTKQKGRDTVRLRRQLSGSKRFMEDRRGLLKYSCQYPVLQGTLALPAIPWLKVAGATYSKIGNCDSGSTECSTTA